MANASTCFAAVLPEDWHWLPTSVDLEEWYRENISQTEPLPERLAAELTAVGLWRQRTALPNLVAVLMAGNRPRVDAIAEFEFQETLEESSDLAELAAKIFEAAERHPQVRLETLTLLEGPLRPSLLSLEEITTEESEALFRFRSWTQASENSLMVITLSSRDPQFLDKLIEAGQLATQTLYFEDIAA